jgi:Ni,Fe-hydrogenase III small subunit/formate hydrogenlyase subunit 6/NADH:ubiquinone oxidoreductase subunit I
MLGWIARGLREGRITTNYPRRPEQPPAGFQGQIRLLQGRGAEPGLAAVCPTGAIAIDSDGTVSVDRGRCILCGACVRAAPEHFTFSERYESAARTREELIEVGRPPRAIEHDREPDAAISARRRDLGEQARALRRSIHIRHIDTGSDGAEEWEIQALWNPYYDIQRLGFFLTASPRHADILIVTGGVTTEMREPLERTWEVMPEPKALVAAGTDACSGGLSSATGETAGGVDRVLEVDVYVPGCPPAPIALLDGLLLAVGLLRAEGAR